MSRRCVHLDDHALDAAAEAHAGRWRPAQDLYQAVVAATAANRALGAGVVGGHDFENGAVVVVEAANEERVDFARGSRPPSSAAMHRFVVRARLGAQLSR